MNKTLIGTVVSTKMQKTVVIDVEKKFRHPLYRKVVTENKKFKAHCEIEGIQEGDVVLIQKVRPISKQKHFMVKEKLDVQGKVIKEVRAPKKEVKKLKNPKSRKTQVKKSTKK